MGVKKGVISDTSVLKLPWSALLSVTMEDNANSNTATILRSSTLCAMAII